ncbi:MAG: FAD-dependent oxidoreductase, partial [Phascolarctobacterium sp.]|nr:FAD-dependent oxidoreductase [Phascolarctobacterium sp.]
MTKDKVFQLKQDAVEKLAEDYGTPLLVLSLEQVKANYECLREYMPRVKVFYAIKANPNPEILKTMIELGSSFDVASAGEIRLLHEMGVTGERFIYANPVKTGVGFKACRDCGVTRMTFDSASEIEKMQKELPGATVLLRLRIDNSSAHVDLNKKFGAGRESAVELMLKAKEAGLDLGAKGSIRVNDKMQTSNEYIYAVGDAIEVKDIVGGSNTVIPLAGPANKQGRIAADNIAGLDSHYKGSLGTSILKAFTMTAASTGLSERGASQLGLEYDYVILSPVSHASYYPGGKVMTMKVLFEKKTGRLLGAQIAGYDGVDKRIDVIATALRAGIKADKLAELELAYAPPYSSAKDPVNMAGFAISNVLEGLVKQFSYSEIPSLKEAGEFLLDTRTPAEYQRGHVEGFVNIPLDELRERLGELGEPKKLYIMCQSGLRSYLSTRILA